MAETPTDPAAQPSTAPTPGLTASAEAATPVSAGAATATTEAPTPGSAAAGDGAPAPTAAGGAEGEAPAAAGGETGAPPKTQERRASRRKTSLKKKGSVVKKEGDQPDRIDEDSEEEVEVPKIIYPIDPKIQETLRKAWTLFIKKGQKKKTEIAELQVLFPLPAVFLYVFTASKRENRTSIVEPIEFCCDKLKTFHNEFLE